MNQKRIPIAVFTVTLPTADDALGRWLDEHGGNISMSCTMGTWRVGVSWRKLISASDDKGRHVEDWDISRYHRKPEVAFERAVRAAMAIQRGDLWIWDEQSVCACETVPH